MNNLPPEMIPFWSLQEAGKDGYGMGGVNGNCRIVVDIWSTTAKLIARHITTH